MKKKIKKYVCSIAFVIVMSFTLLNFSYATEFDLNTVLSDANGFFGNAIGSDGIIPADTVTGIFDQFIGAIFSIGNLVIFCTAAFLGLKYIWSGVDGKASIKETAMNMLAGIIFFYAAQGLYDVFSEIVKGIITGSNSFDDMASSVWGNVAYVVRILAVLGFVIVGVKYMLTSADTKADIKKSLFPVVLGLIIVFCLSEVLTFIVDVTSDTLGENGIDTPTQIQGGEENAKLKEIMDKVSSNAVMILQVLAVGAVVFAGIRYMFASADTRADIKTQTVILLAGAIMVFGGMEIIKMVQKVGNDIFK